MKNFVDTKSKHFLDLMMILYMTRLINAEFTDSKKNSAAPVESSNVIEFQLKIYRIDRFLEPRDIATSVVKDAIA